MPVEILSTSCSDLTRFILLPAYIMLSSTLPPGGLEKMKTIGYETRPSPCVWGKEYTCNVKLQISHQSFVSISNLQQIVVGELEVLPSSPGWYNRQDDRPLQSVSHPSPPELNQKSDSIF